jgi:hypothetical protein
MRERGLVKMRARQRRPRAFFTDTALCPSGRRRCPGSTPWRARAGSVFSVPTWTASPRRRSAGRASWSACTPRRAGSRYCRRAAAPDPRGRRGRPARAARHRPPARPHTRCFHPRGAGSRQPPRRRGRAARDDRTSRLAGVRRGLSSPTASVLGIAAFVPVRLTVDCCRPELGSRFRLTLQQFDAQQVRASLSWRHKGENPGLSVDDQTVPIAGGACCAQLVPVEPTMARTGEDARPPADPPQYATGGRPAAGKPPVAEPAPI